MNDPAELQRFYDETVRPLVAYDEQYETDLLGTLSTFLECDANVNATAARLITHRHTIRYRFERVRELTGLDVSSTDGREKLSLGLKAMRVLGHRGAARTGDRARRRGRAGPPVGHEPRPHAVGARSAHAPTGGRRMRAPVDLTALDRARHHLAGDLERLGAAERPRQHERALERGEHRDRQLARLLGADAGVGVARGAGRDPALEHLGARLAHRLAAARHLERDGRDRAGVGVVGLDQVLRRRRRRTSRTPVTTSGAVSNTAGISCS